MKPGDKIKMTKERQRYTVMACDARWIIATKPFNARRSYLYTIIDRERKRRGPCNYLLGLPTIAEVNTAEGAAEAMELLQSGEMEVSRRGIALTPDEIERFCQ